PVPLVWPESATRIDAKVRVWCEQGTWPTLGAPPLAEPVWVHRLERVPGRDSLPALYLHGSAAHLPLQIRLQDAAASQQAGLVIDRGLIQMLIEADGAQTYRARFMLRKLNVKHIDLELAMPVAQLKPTIILDKEKITTWPPLANEPNVLRLPVDPNLYS